MAFLADEMQEEARAAIEEMKRSAINARAIHARAELMRHMLAAARKVKRLPRDEAIDTVVREWMNAWHLAEDAYPEVAAEMRGFTTAYCAFAETEGEAADKRLRSALAALESTLGRLGTTLADQMAWRSECAHGWWEMVVPTPLDLPGRADRTNIPTPKRGQPFWNAECAPHCRG